MFTSFFSCNQYCNKCLFLELLYDTAISLLNIYSNKATVQKDICTPLFIAAIFTIAKAWKQPKYPSTDEWIKIWYMYIYTHTQTYIYTYIYTMKYYSAIKMNKVISFAATWMQLESIILSEVSQKEKHKYHMISLNEIPKI